MTKTKNMFYQTSQEATELFLYATNTSELYPQICAIVRNLAKKLAKGIYDSDKAIIAFYHVVNTANNLYKKWYGYGFSVTDRYTAAVDMRDYYYENIVNNDI